MRKNYLFAVLILIALALGFYWGSGNKRDEYQDEFYFNMIHDIYKSSSVVSSYLSYVDEWTEYDVQELNKNMSEVMLEIAILQNDLDFFFYYSDGCDWKHISILQEFSDSLRLLNYIVSDGLRYNNEFISNDFLEDGVLDSEEISFLQATQEEFEYIAISLDNAGRQNQEDGVDYSELRNSLDRFTERYSDMNINNLKVSN